MVLSMTGYGRASATYQNKKISIEIKSLNGKSADLRLKIPISYKKKEMEIRRILLDHALRGKLEATILVEDELGSLDYGLNKRLFKKYYIEISKLMTELEIQNGDVVSSILRIPNVLQSDDLDLEDEEWSICVSVINAGLQSLEEFRNNEGRAMYRDLEKGIQSIESLLDTVSPFEKDRLDMLRSKILKNIEEGRLKERIDHNRFEQEILYYLEKLDINEEKVRLKQHCIYFMDALNQADTLKGRKLGFIAQEIGREINTMGAKAQFSPIQKLVVQMKDELEQIKEQLANIV